ncbi:MAG: radical SAM protein, partial [Acidobacteriota bacterium]
MTDVLLAHGFFLRNDPKQIEKMRPYPPLGTLYAASQLRQAGFDVALFDAMLADGEHELESALADLRPRIVAFYEDTFHFLNKMCLTHAREATCRMARLAHGAGAKVLAAGADVSDHAPVYFDHGVDAALLGEADHTIVDVVSALLANPKATLDGIAGLALPVLGGSDERRTAARPHERHPDIFPFPAWDLVDIERYRRAWTKAHGYFSLNMVTTRGCPFHCNWCSKPIWGQQYAMRSPANVAEEMALIRRTLAPDHLWFADDIFGLQPRWVAEFAAEVESRDAAIPFSIQSRVDLMTEKAVAALARAGCTEVWLGAESGSQKVLDAMDKGTHLEAIPEARERLGEAGIKACFFLQFGYPGETWNDILATIELVRQTLPDDIGVSVSYPLPGTGFHRMVKAELNGKDHWDDSRDLAMMFQGTYRTPFYRQLHKVLHQELEVCRQPADAASDAESERAGRERLEASWARLRRLEVECRSEAPTHITKTYAQPSAPDL